MATETPLARWLSEEMPRKGYPLEGPRAGGITRLADDAGISRAAMSRIVNGQGEPSPDSLRRIGKVLGYNLGQMMIFAGLASEEEINRPVVRTSQVEIETPALDVIENPDFDLDLVEEKLHGFRTGRQGEEERRLAAMTASPWYDRVAVIEMLRRVVDAEERRSEEGQDKRPSRGA